MIKPQCHDSWNFGQLLHVRPLSAITLTRISLRSEKLLKPFTMMAVVLLALIAVLHLLRLVLGWEVAVNGLVVPFWPSAIAFVIVAGLAIMVWREARRGSA